MTDKEIIRAAYYELAAYPSQSLTRQQQEREIERCYTLLVDAVYGKDEEVNESR
jgi:hypothetical protein